MRQFYEAYQGNEIVSALLRQLPWTHNLIILNQSKRPDAQMPDIGDDRKAKTNPLSANFDKKEFKALWNRINHKAAYTVHFETPELIQKCVTVLGNELKVSPLQYTIVAGEQIDTATYDEVKHGESFEVKETTTSPLP